MSAQRGKCCRWFHKYDISQPDKFVISPSGCLISVCVPVESYSDLWWSLNPDRNTVGIFIVNLIPSHLIHSHCSEYLHPFFITIALKCLLLCIGIATPLVICLSIFSSNLSPDVTGQINPCKIKPMVGSGQSISWEINSPRPNSTLGC